MKTLNFYIGTSFIRYFLMVLAILGFLITFIEFISQLDDVGNGNYQFKDALIFIGLTMPGRLVDIIPVSTLLGSIIALGLMADNNELMAMQANGISVGRICLSVIMAGALPMAIAVIISEMMAPPMDQLARMRRMAAMADTDITLTTNGFWLRNGPYFVHVRKTHHGGIPSDVDIFEWDTDGHLRTFTHARNATITKDRQWILTDIEKKNFSGQSITTESQSTLKLDSFLSSKQMAIQNVPPESLSPSDLYQYTRMLKERGQNADQYTLVFWQKIGTPLTTCAMVLLSLTFIFGPTRGMNSGYRIMMGSIAGIVLHLLNQVFGHLGLLLSLNPMLTTMAPVAVICCLSFWLLSRGH